MSAWDSYISNMTASGLQISGIYGHEGGVWATSPKLQATQAEVSAIVQAIKTGNFDNGVCIGGKKCTVIMTSPDSVTAKCRNAECDDEKYLVHVALGKQCVVIGGICGPNERDSTRLVEDIRDHLLKSEY